MTTILCVWCCLLTFGDGPTPVPRPSPEEAAMAAINAWCPKIDGEAKAEYLTAFLRYKALTPESNVDDVKNVLGHIDLALGKVGTESDCSTMHALRGALYHELALRQARGDVDPAGTKQFAGKAIHAYDSMVDYVDIRESLVMAKLDLRLAQRIEKSGPDDAVTQRLITVERAIEKVDVHLVQRRKEVAAAAEAAETKRMMDQERKAKIWGGIAVVGGGVAGALGVAFLSQGVVVEALECVTTCNREFRRESLVAGTATSLVSGALLGLGLHQLVRSKRLRSDGPFPERPVGVILMLASIAPLAIGGALWFSGDHTYEKADVSDTEAWQSGLKRMNSGWAVLGLAAPILGSGIGLRVPVKRPGLSASLRLVTSITSATLTLQF